MTAYETHIGNAVHTHNSVQAAVEDVEAAGGGMLLSLHGERNAPFCLPEIVWRTSCGWVLDTGTWYAVEMHGGGSGRWIEHPLTLTTRT